MVEDIWNVLKFIPVMIAIALAACFTTAVAIGVVYGVLLFFPVDKSAATKADLCKCGVACDCCDTSEK